MARFLPPEWAPHASVWMGWPHLEDAWAEDFDGAKGEVAAFVRAAAAFVTVKVAAGTAKAERAARDAIGDVAEIHRIPTGDIWLRDTGPIIVRDGKHPSAQIFRFNGWGEKYILEGDDETAGAIAAHEGIAAETHHFVLEGGAIDVDGDGRLLTTRQCVLNPNRNAGWTEAAAEAAFRTAFGVREIIWLGDGLLNDHTDGHVDNIARFIAPGHVVCQTPSGSDDPNADTLNEIEDALRAHGLKVSTVPSPGYFDYGDGEPVPASHMNFKITNGGVILPVYNDRFGKAAQMALQALMPAHQVIALPAEYILTGGGSFHCMSREIPVEAA